MILCISGQVWGRNLRLAPKVSSLPPESSATITFELRNTESTFRQQNVVFEEQQG